MQSVQRRVAQATTIQTPPGISSPGGSVQAIAAPLLWDQPPASPYTDPILEFEEPGNKASSTYQVHDVVFPDDVHMTSICMWYTNWNFSWVSNITQARLNIFTNDPPLASDDPTAGNVFPAIATMDGFYVKVEAFVALDLAAGTYWIGLTPMGDIDSLLGREYHINSDVSEGFESWYRNPGGGIGIGADWAEPHVAAGTHVFEGAIRIAGSLQDLCADQCTARCEQRPDRLNGLTSDPGLPQVMAENCIVTQEIVLCELLVWGTYAFGQTAPASDLFQLQIHADVAGLPGPVLFTDTAISVIREPTGLLIAGTFEEYRYSLTPSALIALPPGIYWFEVLNDTSADPDDDWFWETGTVDPDNGIPSAARSVVVPGANWVASVSDLAMRVCGRAPFLLVDCAPECDATVLQLVNEITGYISDADDSAAPQFAMAEDFVLSERTELCDITIQGVFALASTPTVPDSFTLIIHADQLGLPGAAIYTESGVPSTRVPRGTRLFGLYDEYEFVLTPSDTVVLPPGSYWIEIFNDTTGDLDDSWIWMTGGPDPNVSAEHAVADQAPGVSWAAAANDFALRICGKPAPPCTSFCTSLPNATGSAALLTCTGDPGSSLILTSSPVPNTTGQFFFGPMMLAGASALGDGLRCVGGSTTRLLPFVSAGMMMQSPNTASIALNYTAPYASGLTGTQYFQHWYRSGLATGTGSNTSNAVSITF